MVHTRARTRQLREFAPRLIPLGRRRPQCRGAKCHLGSSWGCNGLRVCLRDDLAHWVNQWCPSHSFPPPLPLPPLLLPGEVSFEGNLDNSLSSIVLCFILSLSLSPSHTHTHAHTHTRTHTHTHTHARTQARRHARAYANTQTPGGDGGAILRG